MVTFRLFLAAQLLPRRSACKVTSHPLGPRVQVDGSHAGQMQTTACIWIEENFLPSGASPGRHCQDASVSVADCLVFLAAEPIECVLPLALKARELIAQHAYRCSMYLSEAASVIALICRSPSTIKSHDVCMMILLYSQALVIVGLESDNGFAKVNKHSKQRFLLYFVFKSGEMLLLYFFQLFNCFIFKT